MKRGFTLIELLIVIGIVGILAGMVITAVGGARAAAFDAKVKGQLYHLHQAAEGYYSTNHTYAASTMVGPDVVCTGDMFTDVDSGLNALSGTASAWPGGTLLSCQATTDGYAVSANLSDGTFWCVDSQNLNQAAASQQAADDITCDAS